MRAWDSGVMAGEEQYLHHEGTKDTKTAGQVCLRALRAFVVNHSRHFTHTSKLRT